MRCAPICLTVAGVLLLSPLACQEPQKTTSPGALPQGEFDNGKPRLDASTYYAHGNLLERQGNLTEARVRYERALELTPHFTAARNRLGITLNKLGDHAAASEHFLQALEEKPNAAYLYNNLGFSQFLQEQYKAAWHSYSQALEINPNFARARMNAAVALARLGRYSESWDHFRQVGSEADAYYNLAVIQTESGAYVEAATSLDQALKLNPGLAAARQQLRTIARLAAKQAAERDAAIQTGGDAMVAASIETTPPKTPPANATVVPPNPATVRNTPVTPMEPVRVTPPKPVTTPEPATNTVESTGHKMIPVTKVTQPAAQESEPADKDAAATDEETPPAGVDARQVMEWIDELREDVDRALSIIYLEESTAAA